MAGLEMADAPGDKIKWPVAVLRNVSKTLGVDDAAAQYYARMTAGSIVTAYATRGWKLFWTQVDAQVLAVLLDVKVTDPMAAAFRDAFGVSAIDDLAACEAEMEKLDHASQQALNNLPYWLWFALCSYRRFADWEKYSQMFVERMQLSALCYLCTPLLKRCVEQVAELGTLIRERREAEAQTGEDADEKKGDAKTADADRVEELRLVLRDDSWTPVQLFTRDILFDALMRADSTCLAKDLKSRLARMREATKSGYFERRDNDLD